MDRETKQEFSQLRSELDENLGGIDEVGGEQVDQRSVIVDEIFSSIDQAIGFVHAANNKLTQDFHRQRLADEERQTVLKMFDTIMHKLEPLQEFSSVKARVEQHETRIAALETAVGKF